MKEYKQIDLVTGEIIETYLLDSSLSTILEDYKETWSNKHIFYNPIYDLNNDCWIEGLTQEEIDSLPQDVSQSLEDKIEEQDQALQFLMFDLLPYLESEIRGLQGVKGGE